MKKAIINEKITLYAMGGFLVAALIPPLSFWFLYPHANFVDVVIIIALEVALVCCVALIARYLVMALRSYISETESTQIFLKFIKDQSIQIDLLRNISNTEYSNFEKVSKEISDIRIILEKYLDQEGGLSVIDIPGNIVLIDRQRKELFETPIKDLDISLRAYNILNMARIASLGELACIDEINIMKYKGLGEGTLRELKGLLESKGLKFGMKFNSKKE
jgi:hypothetical protein